MTVVPGAEGSVVLEPGIVGGSAGETARQVVEDES